MVVLSFILGCSGFTFMTENGWFDTVDVNYELKRQPLAYIVNCSKHEVHCFVKPNSFMYNSTRQWLEQHWNHVRVINKAACVTSEMGHTIQAELSCAKLPVESAWQTPSYNASQCTLAIHTTQAAGLIISLAVIVVLSAMYLVILLVAKYKLKTQQQPKQPFSKLHRNVSIQAILFILINAALAAYLVHYYSISEPCNFNGIEHDVFLIAGVLCFEFILFISFLMLSLFSMVAQ